MAAETGAARTIRTIVETIRPQLNVKLWDGTQIGAFDGPTLAI
jgi:cyclopropane-fatty-acyl-phospholipid synthase